MSLGHCFRLLLLGFLTSLPAHAMSGINLPGVSRNLTTEESIRVGETILNEIQPYDPLSASQLLNRLESGLIKVWIREGYGFTNPITGTIAIQESFLNPHGTFYYFRKELYAEQQAHKPYPLAPMIPFVRPHLPEPMREKAQRMFLASMLVHENVHCDQGRRRLIVGDVAVLAAAHISSAFGGLDPMEIEAYQKQLEYANLVRDHLIRGRRMSNLSRDERFSVGIADAMVGIVETYSERYAHVHRR